MVFQSMNKVGDYKYGHQSFYHQCQYLNFKVITVFRIAFHQNKALHFILFTDQLVFQMDYQYPNHHFQSFEHHQLLIFYCQFDVDHPFHRHNHNSGHLHKRKGLDLQVTTHIGHHLHNNRFTSRHQIVILITIPFVWLFNC